LVPVRFSTNFNNKILILIFLGTFALKTMSIKRILESKQAEHVRNEKNILSKIDHPFLVRLQWTTHTSALLYLLLEYLPGGELFQMMRKREKFDAKTAIFYASEVLLGLDYLHHLDILYRDLKPVSFHFRISMIYFLFLGKYFVGY
jgi:serine/threonine protein kinase